MNFLSGNNSKAPLVVKLGGSALEDPDARVELWRALRELHASLAGGLVLMWSGIALLIGAQAYVYRLLARN